MAIAIERGNFIFRKVERELVRISSDQGPEGIHSFRTSTRRLQTLLENLLPARDRNQKKLLKALNRIRKSAGKLRDIDAQLSALRTMKVSLEPRRKTQLVQELLELRAKHESKLCKLLKKNYVRELQKRLKRAAKDVSFDTPKEALVVAREVLASAFVAANSADESALHRFRIAVKRARYAAEFAPSSTESKQFIDQLKRLQDVLGHWYDWLTVTKTATDRLGDVTQSSLVAVLQNVTRAKFRQAIVAVAASNPGPRAPAAATRNSGAIPPAPMAAASAVA